MADGGLLVGAAAVAGAAALTVLTAGAGTPILITAIAAVTGGAAAASGLMGASDIIESGQDVYYGTTGNGKAAVNPIRDYVFQGNSDLYNFAEMGAVTISTAGAGALAFAPPTNMGSRAKSYSNSRPRYRKGQVEQVWENAKQPDGKVYDPNTGEELTWDKTKPRNGQWDMGHTPENKYSEWHEKYMSGEITKKEFLDWYRNPDNYRPESPATNRGHQYEN